MQKIHVDLPDVLYLSGVYKDYSNPNAKISALVSSGDLIRLKRGVYLNNTLELDSFLLGKAANRLYGPSYVSFSWALRWYGLIPEDVPNITSATYKRKRTKHYHTPVGDFFYRDIPSSVYPFGLTFEGQGKRRFLAASPEKALCDELSTIPGIRSVRMVQKLLFKDMRLDEERFFKLDFNDLKEAADGYRSDTVCSFFSFLRGLSE